MILVQKGELTRSGKRRPPGGKVLCTALAVTMLLTTTASATAKPWWLSKYRVTFDNELGIVGNATLTFASDGGSFIRPITKKYGESISLESYIPTKYGYTFKGWFTDPRTKQNQVTSFKFTNRRSLGRCRVVHGRARRTQKKILLRNYQARS